MSSPVTVSGKADIVFVVDNTGSMSGIQTTVANNITNFIDSLITQGVTDIKMGLVEYKDSTINNFDFSGSKWTNNTSDIYNGLLHLASTNSGATENAMQALTETSNYYDFRSNDNGNQDKHIIFITNEDADDDADLPSTLSLIQSDGIQVSGVYYTTADDISEFNTIIASTGGVSVNLSNANWGDQLSSIIGSHIASSAGTTAEDTKMPVLTLQVGANSGQEFKVELFDARTKNLGIDGIKVDPIKEAEKSLEKVDKAIALVSNQRSKFGAYQNALDHIKNNVETHILSMYGYIPFKRDGISDEQFEIPANHRLTKGMTEIITYVSQLMPFKEASETIKKLINVEVSPTQMYIVSE